MYRKFIHTFNNFYRFTDRKIEKSLTFSHLPKSVKIGNSGFHEFVFYKGKAQLCFTKTKIVIDRVDGI
jgi:hypothetical protein